MTLELSTKPFRRSALAALLVLSTACAGSERLDPTPAALRGAWSGEATISRIGGKKDQPLPLEIEIGADGRVSGTLGSATIQNGYVASNRGAFGRAIDIKTDYILRGGLEGSVIAGESAPSTFFMAPFNLVEKPDESAHVWGGLTTWDNPSGGKNPIIGAHDLVLRRK